MFARLLLWAVQGLLLEAQCVGLTWMWRQAAPGGGWMGIGLCCAVCAVPLRSERATSASGNLRMAHRGLYSSEAERQSCKLEVLSSVRSST